MEKIPTITVFGSSAPNPGEPAYEAAYRLGGAIARQGWVLCNGGYGGTMAAGAQGASEVGGKTIGVSCGAFGRSGINRWIAEEIRTSNLNERLDTLIRIGDAYVVLPGSTGTLLELAAVWELANKGFAGNKPIVLLEDYWSPVVEIIRRESDKALRCVRQADTVDRVIEILDEALPDAPR